MKKIDQKKKLSSEWFRELRNKICQELEKFEVTGKKFRKKKWNRDVKGTNKLWWRRNECFKRRNF